MCIYQDKCDKLGLSATLRHKQHRTTDQKVAGSNPAERTLPSAHGKRDRDRGNAAKPVEQLSNLLNPQPQGSERITV